MHAHRLVNSMMQYVHNIHLLPDLPRRSAVLPQNLELLYSRDVVGIGSRAKLMAEVVGSTVVRNRRVDVRGLAGLGGGKGPGNALRALGVDVLGRALGAPRGAAMAPSSDLPVRVVGLCPLLVDGVVRVRVGLGRGVSSAIQVSQTVFLMLNMR